jgi:hypothetical protein
MTSTKAILKHERKVERLSVNSLLLTPAKLRWFALGELWWYRACWRLPMARGIMQRERDYEIRQMLPILVVLGIVAGVTIFVVLPSTLREQSATLLASLWPLWVVQVVPMICAQAMAMQNAPNIAIRLTEAELQGDFDLQDIAKHSAQAAHAAVPLIFAHAAVAAAGACLLVLFTLCFGLLAALVLAVGDLRTTIDIVFARVPPLVWLRAAFSAWLLGGVCVTAAVLYAWPGTQLSHSGMGAHRMGLRAMLVASLSCAVAGSFMNWVAGLLGWNGMVA